MATSRGSRARELLRNASFQESRDPGDRPVHRPLPDRRARLVLRSLQASVLVQLLLASAKVAAGGVAEQPFVLAGALVNVGAVVAKVVILLGTGDDPRQRGHYRHYRRAGLVLLVTGVAYGASCAAAAVTGRFTSFSREVGVVIATVAFVELGAAVAGAVTTRRFWTPLIQANKLVNLAGGLVALALTQVAILSFTTTDLRAAAAANTLFTLLTGAAVVGIGAAMAWHGRARLHAAAGDSGR